MYTLLRGGGGGGGGGETDLDGHIFGGIDTNFEEEHVVFDKVALLEHVVRHKAREPETQRIRRPRRTLEVLPRRIRNETLHDITSLVGIGCLVVERETDRVGERPLEEGIVFTGQNFDVNRHVRSFTRSVTVEKQRSLQFVSVLTGVERSADEFESFLDGGLVDLDTNIVDTPQESARVVGRNTRHRRAQCRQLLLLPAGQSAHEQQMLTLRLFLVFLQRVARTLETTAGLFERTGDHQRRAVLFQMRFELLPNYFGRIALIRARNGQTTALAVMYLKCVVSKVFVAVTAGHHPLVALAGLMLQHGLTADFQSALVVAVDRLHRTRPHVAVVLETGEVNVTEFANLAPIGAEIAHVIIVSQSGNVLLAVQPARHRIQRTTQ